MLYARFDSHKVFKSRCKKSVGGGVTEAALWIRDLASATKTNRNIVKINEDKNIGIKKH